MLLPVSVLSNYSLPLSKTPSVILTTIIIIMSHRTLPILFINLGGEMIYIIDARLKAQSVEKERANKVYKEIILREDYDFIC